MTRKDPRRTRWQAMFNGMVQRLGVAVPDPGQNTAGDSTGLDVRRSREDSAAAKAAEAQAAKAKVSATSVASG